MIGKVGQLHALGQKKMKCGQLQLDLIIFLRKAISSDKKKVLIIDEILRLNLLVINMKEQI